MGSVLSWSKGQKIQVTLYSGFTPLLRNVPMSWPQGRAAVELLPVRGTSQYLWPCSQGPRKEEDLRVCTGAIFQCSVNLYSSFGLLELQKARGVTIVNTNRADMSKYFGHLLWGLRKGRRVGNTHTDALKELKDDVNGQDLAHQGDGFSAEEQERVFIGSTKTWLYS